MRLTQEEYDKLKNRSKRSAAKSKQPFQAKPLGKKHTQEKNPKRVGVRITSFRVRLCDPDNVCPKFHVDALRYAGIIRDDRVQDINLFVNQIKVNTKKEERTEIEIIDKEK